jgi:DNA-directed RNA polymerase specialized sigma24 family protein
MTNMDPDKRLQWVVTIEADQDAIIEAEEEVARRVAHLRDDVCKAEAEGMSQAEIGGILGLSRQRVNQIVLEGRAT